MENQIKGVVFKSISLVNITMTLTKGYWEHSKPARHLKPGMQVYIIPTAKALTDNDSTPFAVLATAEKIDQGGDKNWENGKPIYDFRIYLKDIYLVPFSHIEKLMPSKSSVSSIRYIE
jgi:hypothetical protein